MVTKVKSPNELKSMRESGRILAHVLGVLKSQTQAGMNTKDLSEIAKQELKHTGGTPTFLGYRGFPDVLCVSINDEVVHGIPRPGKVINMGDIVSLDFGVTYNGMITDSAISLIVGKPLNQSDAKLVSSTEEALGAGINVLHHNVSVGDIGFAISRVLNRDNYGIVRDLVGHAVGHQLHEIPNIPNYGNKNSGPKLLTGMTIAIEPMATLGDYRVKVDPDNWTVRTTDGSRAAHFEHTVLITDSGYEILTKV